MPRRRDAQDPGTATAHPRGAPCGADGVQLAPGGEITSDVYPSSSDPGRLNVLYVTTRSAASASPRTRRLARRRSAASPTPQLNERGHDANAQRTPPPDRGSRRPPVPSGLSDLPPDAGHRPSPKRRRAVRRGQAVLAAGVLVVSTGAPITPALAAGEPDQEQQGGAPIAADGGDSAANPDFDPAVTRRISRGGSPAGSQAPADADDDDAAAVEQEPAVDQRETVVDAGDGTEPVTNEAASPAPTQSSPTPANDTAEPTSQDTTPVAPSEPSAQAPVDTPVVRADARPAKRQTPRAKHQRQAKPRTQSPRRRRCDLRLRARPRRSGRSSSAAPTRRARSPAVTTLGIRRGRGSVAHGRAGRVAVDDRDRPARTRRDHRAGRARSASPLVAQPGADRDRRSGLLRSARRWCCGDRPAVPRSARREVHAGAVIDGRRRRTGPAGGAGAFSACS